MLVVLVETTASPSAVATDSSTAGDWISIVSTLGAITAAVVAGIFASRAKSAELQAQRVRDLEARLATAKYDVKRPEVRIL